MDKQNNAEAKIFAERLNHALDLRNYPSFGKGRINYVQEVFQISRAGANKWLHGKAIPHKNKRIEICQKLGINQRWLEIGSGSPFEAEPEAFNANKLAHAIPLLTLDQAYDYQKHIENTALEEIVVNHTVSPSAIAVKNAGDAMLPRFGSDNVLIIDTQATVNDGDFIVAKASTIPEAIFRQYVIGSAGKYLVATNPKFDAVKLSDDGMIIGKVVEVRSQL